MLNAVNASGEQISCQKVCVLNIMFPVLNRLFPSESQARVPSGLISVKDDAAFLYVLCCNVGVEVSFNLSTVSLIPLQFGVLPWMFAYCFRLLGGLDLKAKRFCNSD